MTFDYMAWWKYLIKDHGVSPSEAWNMSYNDALYLAEIKSKSDVSMMVNAFRKQNGASEEFLA